MQLKHLKKSFIMSNDWVKTCKVLKKLLDTLLCSKCHKNLHDPQQFLGCGHFLCISCLNNNDTSCNECNLPNESKNTSKDIQQIAEACTIIANVIGYKYNNENIKTDLNEIALTHNNQNDLTLGPALKSEQNLLSKRKDQTNLITKNSKRPKLEKSAPIFRVPKNINKRNHVGESILQTECRKGHIENVKILLEKGADPNLTCNAGWTALQESSDFHYYEIVEILLKFKADVNKPGHIGRTALHEAAKNKDKTMVQLLLSHGANKDLKDEENNKPIDYCQSDEIKILLDPNYEKNEENDKTMKIPEIVDNHNIKSSKVKSRVCEKDIIDINESIVGYPISNNLRRITRRSIYQNNHQESSKNNSICENFTNIKTSTTKKNIFKNPVKSKGKVLNEQNLENGKNLRQNEHCEKYIFHNTVANSLNSESILQDITEQDFEEHKKSKSTFENINNKISKTNGTEILINNVDVINSKNNNGASTSKDTSQENTHILNSTYVPMIDESDDSDVELIFDKMQDSIRPIIVNNQNNKCNYGSSQESIDVVNNSQSERITCDSDCLQNTVIINKTSDNMIQSIISSSNVDSEDLIIDVETV